MRYQPLLLTAALGTLALLAACNKAPPSPAAAEATPPPVAAVTPPPEAPAPAEVPPPPPAPPAAAPAPKPKPKPVVTPVVQPPVPGPKPPPPVVAQVVTVPAGTMLSMSLDTDLSSKTAKVGDAVEATVSNDVLVDGKTAIASGTKVAGSVIKVVSGSDKIGGTPTLAVSFDRLEMPGGKDVPISGEITQQGKSDTARDSVKIVGGTAAGAIVGDKIIKGKKGKFIGGLLGGAVGAVAAQKTGTEVQMTQGTALSVVLGAPVEITK
ncbi:MAG: glycine zipper 2TM domain-containing protein [Pseudomonadota bacterium]